MDELFGFLSVDELAAAIAAWREMEKRARNVLESDDYSSVVHWVLPSYLRWILEPLDALDNAAGLRAVMKAVEEL